jgi:hypothetical protein
MPIGRAASSKSVAELLPKLARPIADRKQKTLKYPFYLNKASSPARILSRLFFGLSQK